MRTLTIKNIQIIKRDDLPTGIRWTRVVFDDDTAGEGFNIEQAIDNALSYLEEK